jgi:hypothetical protein
MRFHLAEISRTVAPGAHAVLPLDRSSWHLPDKLYIPTNVTLMNSASVPKKDNPAA